MKYIFFGTPEFAAMILQKLIEADMPPLALVCNPDKPQGRKKIITPPPSKEIVIKSGLKIDILQPETLDTAFLKKLKNYNADFYVVAAYSKIFKKELLSIPPKGVIGVHPSLLPKLRGASPIQSAILSGANATGVTLFLIDEKVDHGPMLASATYIMERPHTYEAILSILAGLAGNLLVKTLPIFDKGEITPENQNDEEATFTEKFDTADGEVILENIKKAIYGEDRILAEAIDRKIKALNPEPGVFTIINKKRIKLLSSEVKNGNLVLKEIQFEGKKPMPFSQYRQPLF